MTKFDPQGRGVVVTGAANGIGTALATALASRGARVVIADVDTDGVAAVVEQITASGGTAFAAPGDAATEDGVARLVMDARRQLGRIDAWFANAGVERSNGLATHEIDWETSIEVNVLAHVRAATWLIPEWTSTGGGRFVITASAAGVLTMLESPTYSVSKHAAVAFAEWLSATYRHQGVVVQAICPQGVRTQMLENSGDLRAILGHDKVLTAANVAATTMSALGNDRFFILPHPEVGAYYRARATDTDAWLTAMNKLQRRLERKKAIQTRSTRH